MLLHDPLLGFFLCVVKMQDYMCRNGEFRMDPVRNLSISWYFLIETSVWGCRLTTTSISSQVYGGVRSQVQ